MEDSLSDMSSQIPTFKAIILGSSRVGKSCILGQFIDNQYNESYNVTIGAELKSKKVNLGEKKPDIQLQIWDTVGQEQFKSIMKQFYRNISCAILVYDINDTSSFLNLNEWLKELKENVDDKVIIALFGNMCDKQEDQRQVSKEIGQKFCIDNNLQIFYEVSAKTGQNIQSAFSDISLLIYNQYDQQNDKNVKEINQNQMQNNNNQQYQQEQEKLLNLSNNQKTAKKQKNNACC